MKMIPSLPEHSDVQRWTYVSTNGRPDQGTQKRFPSQRFSIENSTAMISSFWTWNDTVTRTVVEKTHNILNTLANSEFKDKRNLM
jgi:hypothetical protein